MINSKISNLKIFLTVTLFVVIIGAVLIIKNISSSTPAMAAADNIKLDVIVKKGDIITQDADHLVLTTPAEFSITGYIGEGTLGNSHCYDNKTGNEMLVDSKKYVFATTQAETKTYSITCMPVIGNKPTVTKTITVQTINPTAVLSAAK